MRVLLVEDDLKSKQELEKKLSAFNRPIIVEFSDSLAGTLQYFSDFSKPIPELLIMNMHLKDGMAIDFFKRTKSLLPVIFTSIDPTEAVIGFEANAVGFLTKPVETDELYKTLDKFYRLNSIESRNVESSFPSKDYQQRFLVKYGQSMQHKNLNEISHFMADGKITYLVQTGNCRRFIIESTLSELESGILDPFMFFRVNRKFIINIEDIKEVKSYAGNRLKILTNSLCENDIIVSREKVKEFKKWMNR
jgi:two-component system, LytTR family, response regulator LytT